MDTHNNDTGDVPTGGECELTRLPPVLTPGVLLVQLGPALAPALGPALGAVKSVLTLGVLVLVLLNLPGEASRRMRW